MSFTKKYLGKTTARLLIFFVIIAVFPTEKSLAIEKDSAFMDGLGKFLDKLNGTTPQKIPEQKVCDDDPAKSSSPLSNVAEAAKNFGSSVFSSKNQSDFKSEGDLRRYFDCYVTEPGRFSTVDKKFLPLIQSAAQTFEIPETLLACLIFRESRFDINALSTAGAIGLGQHLRGTMAHITNILQPVKDSTLKALTEDTKMTLEEQMVKRTRKRGEAIKSLAYAKTRLEDREHRLKWEEYFDSLSSLKLHKGKTPRAINPGTIKDPKIAIGATAMYMRIIITHFKKTLDSSIQIDQSDEEDPNYYLMLAAAGSYNMGYGEAQRILSPIEPPSRKQWVEALTKSNEETAAHILSIKNCIRSPGSNKGPAWLGPIGSHNYDCSAEKSKDGSRPVVGNINRLPAEYRNSIKAATMKKPPAPQKPAPKKPAPTKPAPKPKTGQQEAGKK